MKISNNHVDDDSKIRLNTLFELQGSPISKWMQAKFDDWIGGIKDPHVTHIPYTSDPYLDDCKCIERLVENWKEHGSIIIAFDFDNTIFDYYNKGYEYSKVIELLKECKTMGCTLILYTCCDESKYEFMKEKCAECGLIIDYINESPPNIPFVGKKIYYNILLDDRAGLRSAYNILKKAKEIIKNEKF